MIIVAKFVEDEGGRAVNVTLSEHGDQVPPPLSDTPADLLLWSILNPGSKVVEILAPSVGDVFVDAIALLVALPERPVSAFIEEFGPKFESMWGDIENQIPPTSDGDTWIATEGGWSLLVHAIRINGLSGERLVNALGGAMDRAFRVSMLSRESAARLSGETL